MKICIGKSEQKNSKLSQQRSLTERDSALMFVIISVDRRRLVAPAATSRYQKLFLLSKQKVRAENQ